MIELQGEIEEFTLIIGNFNNLLSETDGSSRQKISKGTVDFSNSVDQLDISGIYKLLHATAAEYAFLSSSHGIFTNIDHVACKTHLSTFKR